MIFINQFTTALLETTALLHTTTKTTYVFILSYHITHIVVSFCIFISSALSGTQHKRQNTCSFVAPGKVGTSEPIINKFCLQCTSKFGKRLSPMTLTEKSRGFLFHVCLVTKFSQFGEFPISQRKDLNQELLKGRLGGSAS